MRRRVLAVFTVAAAASLAWTGSALAVYVDYWLTNQGLSAGNAVASSAAHSHIVWTYADSDHTVCPALSQGYSGYTSTPFSGGRFTAYQSYACAYDGAAWWPTPGSTDNVYFRGAAYNPNSVTFDNIRTAYYCFGSGC